MLTQHVSCLKRTKRTVKVNPSAEKVITIPDITVTDSTSLLS